MRRNLQIHSEPLRSIDCSTLQSGRQTNLNHPKPHTFSGPALGREVWRYIGDNRIMRPDMIKMQVPARQEELQAQGESADGEIAHAWHRLTNVEQERTFYERYAARGKIGGGEFDARTILCPVHPCSPYVSVLYSVGKEEIFGLRFEPIA